MFEIIADGIAWVDSDGNSVWPWDEAGTLAAALEGMGYTVTLEEV